jgi:hypothetical protein
MLGLDGVFDADWERHCDAQEAAGAAAMDAARELEEQDAALGQAHLDLGAAARAFEAGGLPELARTVRAVMRLANATQEARK